MTTATVLPGGAGRRCQSVLNVLHSLIYFCPELPKELAPYGFESSSSHVAGQAGNFAVRAAPLGAVGAGTVTATFYNYSPRLIAQHIPRVWELASPQTVLAARLRAADSALRRVLGAETATSAEVAEAAELALRATEAGTRAARPLYAANADLPVPKAPHLALWHAATLLREHRGDGHMALLLRAGLDPVEAIVTHNASGKGLTSQWLLRTRGWGRADWSSAQERLRERGLLNAAGELTDRGLALREELEEETDRLDRAPYEHLGAAGVARLTELATGLSEAVVAAGTFPADLRGKG